MSIYIVEISCQLLDVLLQLIRCLQAILEETGGRKVHVNLAGSGIYGNYYLANVRSCTVLLLATMKVTQREREIGAVYV